MCALLWVAACHVPDFPTQEGGETVCVPSFEPAKCEFIGSDAVAILEDASECADPIPVPCESSCFDGLCSCQPEVTCDASVGTLTVSCEVIGGGELAETLELPCPSGECSEQTDECIGCTVTQTDNYCLGHVAVTMTNCEVEVEDCSPFPCDAMNGGCAVEAEDCLTANCDEDSKIVTVLDECGPVAETHELFCTHGCSPEGHCLGPPDDCLVATCVNSVVTISAECEPSLMPVEIECALGCNDSMDGCEPCSDELAYVGCGPNGLYYYDECGTLLGIHTPCPMGCDEMTIMCVNA